MESGGGAVWDGDDGGVPQSRRLIGRYLEVGVIAHWTRVRVLPIKPKFSTSPHDPVLLIVEVVWPNW